MALEGEYATSKLGIARTIAAGTNTVAIVRLLPAGLNPIPTAFVIHSEDADIRLQQGSDTFITTLATTPTIATWNVGLILQADAYWRIDAENFTEAFLVIYAASATTVRVMCATSIDRAAPTVVAQRTVS